MNTEHTYRVRKLAGRLLIDDRLLLRLGGAGVKLEPYDELNREIFERLSEPTTRSDLLSAVGAKHGEAGSARAADVFDEFGARGFLERCDMPHDLHPLDVERFDRFLHWLSGFEDDATTRFDLLQRLRSSKVVVIGTGGMGSWVIYNLLCCGVGRLKLVDGDVVEYSNLNRSILYTEADVGKPKIEVARAACIAFAPRTEIELLQRMVFDPSDLDGELDDCDLVVATADRPPWLVKHRIAEACHRAQVALLHVVGFRSGPFYVPGESSCSMCEWAQMLDRNPQQADYLRAQLDIPRQDVGALSHYGSITGGVAAYDAVSYLVGQRPTTFDAVWWMDATFKAGLQPVARHPRCAVCGDRSAEYGLHRVEEPVS